MSVIVLLPRDERQTRRVPGTHSDPPLLSDPQQQEPRHPQVITQSDPLARTDLELPLSGHDLGVDTGDLDTGVETGSL